MIISQKKNLVSPGTFTWPIYVKIIVLMFQEFFSERGSNGKRLDWDGWTGSTMNTADISRGELQANTEPGKLKEEAEISDNSGET